MIWRTHHEFLARLSDHLDREWDSDPQQQICARLKKHLAVRGGCVDYHTVHGQL